MASKAKGAPASKDSRSLVESLAADLRQAILDGDIPVGGKLPSEAQLTKNHGVSRTVVREAVAALRSEGLVEPRQGAGVFVIEAKSAFPPQLKGFDFRKLSNLVEMMELRIAVETGAATLAAKRRSPAQLAQIQEALEAMERAADAGRSTGQLDLEFHLSIARATNNPRFLEFLEALGERAIPRARIGEGDASRAAGAFYSELRDEHRRIATAISLNDPSEAGLAMRAHLEKGLQRYQERFPSLI